MCATMIDNERLVQKFKLPLTKEADSLSLTMHPAAGEAGAAISTDMSVLFHAGGSPEQPSRLHCRVVKGNCNVGIVEYCWLKIHHEGSSRYSMGSMILLRTERTSSC